MKKKVMALLILISTAACCFSQSQNDSSHNKIFMFVPQMPEFPNGEAELMKFLQENLRYPDEARSNNVEGKVVAQFIVSEDGSISDATIVHGIGSGCDEEVLRVLQLMPKWNPGRLENGNAVKVYFKLPVTFKLTESKPYDPTQPNITLPSYPGSDSALADFINKNLQYPKEAKKLKVAGSVLLSFTVDENGVPQNVAVARSVGSGCDEEALRIFKLIPKWTPGTRVGKPVSMAWQLQVPFYLK